MECKSAMPWKEENVLEQRYRFQQEWNTDDWSLAELCRDFGISRKTGYKWLERYDQEGVEGLKDQSRAPREHPNALDDSVEEQVIAIREKHPSWGARKIRACLERDEAPVVPATSTIGAILRTNGLTLNLRRKPASRPTAGPLAHATEANRVWCADFKGWFRTADRERIDPLTITDAHTRYLLRCQSVKGVDYAHSKPVFEAAFREYGLPERIRTDNGAPFGSNGESGLTGLSVWWIMLGIQPERISPGKPQQNGRHERMHRTLKEETASPPATNRRAQQQRFDAFRREYNEERPHEALGQKTPASLYVPSSREYPKRLPDICYPIEWTLRRVSPGGQMRWRKELVFVAHALGGQTVGLEPIDDRYWRVWFSFYEVGVMDTKHLRVVRPARWEKRRAK